MIECQLYIGTVGAGVCVCVLVFVCGSDLMYQDVIGWPAIRVDVSFADRWDRVRLDINPNLNPNPIPIPS